MMHHERVLAAMQTQADTVARLERERNQAWEEFRALSVRAGANAERLERELAEVRAKIEGLTVDEDWTKDDHVAMVNEANEQLQAFASGLELNLAAVIQRAEAAEAKLAVYKSEAEALRALAAWVNADKGWRKVSEICSGELFAFEVTIQFWRGNDGKQQVRGEADTLAAAIMDAMGQVGK